MSCHLAQPQSGTPTRHYTTYSPNQETPLDSHWEFHCHLWGSFGRGGWSNYTISASSASQNVNLSIAPCSWMPPIPSFMVTPMPMSIAASHTSCTQSPGQLWPHSAMPQVVLRWKPQTKPTNHHLRLINDRIMWIFNCINLTNIPSSISSGARHLQISMQGHSDHKSTWLNVPVQCVKSSDMQ